MKIALSNPHKLTHMNHRELTSTSECVYMGWPNTEQVCRLLHRKEVFLNLLFRILLRAWHAGVDHHQEAGKMQHELTEDSSHCFRWQCSRVLGCLEKFTKCRGHDLGPRAHDGEAPC
jgi:hypothetical protein